jgi:S-formylglutathione hydrolase FrmB
MNLFSKSLMRLVPVVVILPIDHYSLKEGEQDEDKPFKTLYLLHGAWGGCMDWLTGTRIYRLAEEYKLAVVMPTGDNSFYMDHEASRNHFGEFTGKELIEVTRRMFPLSRKREDTYIAGLSMGGYGAVYLGLKYSDTFSYIASLSGAFDPVEIRDFTYDFDPKLQVKQLCAIFKAKSALQPPKIYLGCGTEDEALIHNRELRDDMIEEGFAVTYEEDCGKHEWDYWDRTIKRILKWLPL